MRRQGEAGYSRGGKVARSKPGPAAEGFRPIQYPPVQIFGQVAAELIENRIYFCVWNVAAVSWDSARGVHLASVLASLEKSARTNMIAPGAVVAQFSVN